MILHKQQLYFCLQVMLAIEPTEHLHVRSELTSSVCIARRSKAVVMFRVVPVKLGTANISIKAEVDPHAADECGPALHDYKVSVPALYIFTRDPDWEKSSAVIT